MEYWLKQTTDKPLFEDILWARPETKQNAGKLLIVGGNVHGFAAAQEAYANADAAGAGHIRLILPDALKRTIGVLGPYDYAPSTPSGGFGQDALNELLIGSNWADAVLIAGDLGRNSETAILLEKFVSKFNGLLTLTKDTIDYFNHQPHLIAERSHTTLVLSMSQLQKLGMQLRFEAPFLLSMGMLLLVQALHSFTKKYPVTIITKELDHIVVAHQGRVTSTKLPKDLTVWRVATAARTSVLWMQNPNKPFEAMTSSLVI